MVTNEPESIFSTDGVRRVLIDAGARDIEVYWISEVQNVLTLNGSAEIKHVEDEMFVTLQPAETRRQTSSPPPVRVSLPDAMPMVVIESERGAIHLDGLAGDVELQSDDGDIDIRNGAGTLNVNAGAGTCRLQSLSGEITLLMGSGNSRVQDLDGRITIKCGSGDIQMTQCSGIIDLTTGSGDLDLSDIHDGTLSVVAGSGNLQVTGGSVVSLDVRTGSGDVSLDAVYGIDSKHQVRTGSGDIDVALPRTIPARVEAVTGRGNLESAVPMVIVGQRGPRSRRSNRHVGTIGSGADRAEITLRTQSGDVRLRWSEHKVPVRDAHTHQATSIDRLDDPLHRVLTALAAGEISSTEANMLIQNIDREKRD